jgi:hypothetical protein
MIRFAPLAGLAAVAALLAGCATNRIPDALGDRPLLANPSAVIATEIAFARAAQDDGQWTAFRRFATDDADMFVPARVRAQDWLKGRTDPAQAVRWQTQRVVMSCDGNAAVSTGAWQRPDGSQGYFTTVWRRQNDGRWKWVLDHGDVLAVPRESSDAISSRVASCEALPTALPAATATGGDAKQGAARDNSLVWSSVVAPDGARSVAAHLWNGTAFETVLEDTVAAE